jgi:hypothetical protein
MSASNGNEVASAGMNNANSLSAVNKIGRWGRRLLKVGMIAAAVVMATHMVWVRWGSGEWTLASDSDGIRVWTMKAPGQALLKYRLQMHVESHLSDVVFYMSDLKTGYDVGATEIRRIEQVLDDPVFLAYDTYKLDLKPFGQMDVVIVNHYSQDPKTGVVMLNVHAAPNKIPVDPNVPRVKHLSNRFTFTPAAGGVDIDLVSDADLGLPYMLQNLVMPKAVHEEFAKMRETMKRPRYREGIPAFIVDPAEQAAVKGAKAVAAP